MTLADFTDAANPDGTDPGQYTAAINWGDGTLSDGGVSSDGSGGFFVTGSHAWIASGTFSLAIVASRDGA